MSNRVYFYQSNVLSCFSHGREAGFSCLVSLEQNITYAIDILSGVLAAVTGSACELPKPSSFVTLLKLYHPLNSGQIPGSQQAVTLFTLVIGGNSNLFINETGKVANSYAMLRLATKMILAPFTNVRQFSNFNIEYIHTKISEHTYYTMRLDPYKSRNWLQIYFYVLKRILNI